MVVKVLDLPACSHWYPCISNPVMTLEHLWMCSNSRRAWLQFFRGKHKAHNNVIVWGFGAGVQNREYAEYWMRKQDRCHPLAQGPQGFFPLLGAVKPLESFSTAQLQHIQEAKSWISLLASQQLRRGAVQCGGASGGGKNSSQLSFETKWIGTGE